MSSDPETREIRAPLADDTDLVVRWSVSAEVALDEAAADLLAFWGNEAVDGQQAWYGWSLLTLHATDDGLLVCEPDFLSDDPALQAVPHATVTLQVAAMQRRLHALTDLDVEPCTCAHTLNVPLAGLDHEEISMVRGEPSHDGDSGWMVLPSGRSGEMAEVRTYALLRLRPALLKALTMPTGSVVTFRGGRVVSLRDYENFELLREPDPDDGRFWMPPPPEVEEAEPDDVTHGDEPQEEAPHEQTPTSGWLGRWLG
jgi:hypothetical protein